MSRPQKPYTPKTDIAIRLGEFFKGENFLGISRKVGISDAMVAACMKGEIETPLEVLRYIAEQGGDVNWILTGKRRGGECVGGDDNPTLRVAVANWNDMEDADQVTTSAEEQAKADDAKGGADDPVAAKSFWTNKPHVRSVKPWTFGREVALTAVLILGGFFVAPYAIVGVAPLWLFLAYALTMRRTWRWCEYDERKWPAVLFFAVFLAVLALVCYCLSVLLGGGRSLSVVGHVVLIQVVFWVLSVSCMPGYANAFESVVREKFGKGLLLERGDTSQADDARMRESGTADKDKLMADELVLKPLNETEGLLADVADKWRILGGDDGWYEATEWQICMTGAIADVSLSLLAVARSRKLPSGKKERRAMKAARRTIKKALAWTPPARPERPARSQEQSCDEPGDLDENELVVNQVDEDYALERVWESLLMVCSLDEVRDDQIDDMIARADVVLCRVAKLAWRVKRVAWWDRMTPEERAKIDSMIE